MHKLVNRSHYTTRIVNITNSKLKLISDVYSLVHGGLTVHPMVWNLELIRKPNRPFNLIYLYFIYDFENFEYKLHDFEKQKIKKSIQTAKTEQLNQLTAKTSRFGFRFPKA